MKFGLLSIYLLTASLFSNNASAQSQQEDSIFFQTAVDHTVAVYYDQLGDQSRLFNGSLYAGLDLTFQKGSPFFLSDKPSAGSVVYDSIYYPNLAIFYEDYRQTLVVVDHAFPLRLINEKVSAFNIADHHFEYVFSDLNRGIATAGFYEVLYNGRSRLLKHTSKKIREVLSTSEGLRRYMDEFNDYYIKGRSSYFNVSSKRELFKFVGVHKKEIQRFIRKNNLDFRDDKDNTLSKVAAYYDQIANN
ncbi:MAG TPA: hypothetical protein VK772_16450 [Puia sp.]|nr:hypothetical protein [Puia sp.]